MKSYDPKLPSISVVITTYNEEAQIDRALSSVEKQKYPKDKIEIIVVDDESADSTVDIARKYTDKIFISGKHYCEISRVIGLENAENELIFFIDADNELPARDFILRLATVFVIEGDIVGAYPEKFYYDSNDHSSNRYCTLYGINDPLQYYTNAREHLSYSEEGWELVGDASDKGDYYLVEFPKGSLLTLGAIGFLGRKDLMRKKINKNGYFFHSDAFNELISEGYNKFAVVKQDVIHHHVNSHKEFIKKLDRNIGYFLNHGSVRETVWVTKNPFNMIKSAIIMGTVVVPLADSIKGYIKFRDFAWFLHPVYCFAIFWVYAFRTIEFKTQQLFLPPINN